MNKIVTEKRNVPLYHQDMNNATSFFPNNKYHFFASFKKK
jgi:hypothetical protein